MNWHVIRIIILVVVDYVALKLFSLLVREFLGVSFLAHVRVKYFLWDWKQVASESRNKGTFTRAYLSNDANKSTLLYLYVNILQTHNIVQFALFPQLSLLLNLNCLLIAKFPLGQRLIAGCSLPAPVLKVAINVRDLQAPAKTFLLDSDGILRLLQLL